MVDPTGYQSAAGDNLVSFTYSFAHSGSCSEGSCRCHPADGWTRLPADYGTDDLTLVIQDRRFDGRGRMVYDPGMRDEMMGFTGDVILVNGQVGARALVPRGIVRLRLLNGSNARVYDLASRAERSLHLVATDAGFLDRPAPLKILRLAPGERAEVLIDFTDGANDVLVSGPNPNAGMMSGRGMMGGGMMDSAEEAGFDVLPIEVDSARAARIDRLPESIGGVMLIWTPGTRPGATLHSRPAWAA